MKKYTKELLIFLLQLTVFYITPLCAGPTDMMGVVLLIVIATLTTSLFVGILSTEKVKYFYPAAIAVTFIPCVFLYYNSSALVHTLWYFGVSVIGLATGIVIQKLLSYFKKKTK